MCGVTVIKNPGVLRAAILVAALAVAGAALFVVLLALEVSSGQLREVQREILRAAPDAYTKLRAQASSTDAALDALRSAVPHDGWRLVRVQRPGPPEGAPGGGFGGLPPEGFGAGPPREAPPADRPGGGAPGGPPGNDPSVVGALAAATGLVPRRVPLDDVLLEVTPDLVRFGGTFVWAALAGVLGMLAALGGAWWALGAADAARLEPVERTADALERLAEHDFTPRSIVTDAHGPPGNVARAYNAAAEQIAAVMRKRDATQAEMQRFIADAGHELRTPITIIMGYLEVLEGAAAPAGPTAERIVRGVRAETGRMRTLIEQLILLSRLESTEARLEPVDIVGIVSGVRENLAPLAGERTIVLDAPPAATALGDDGDLHEAVYNLVQNALKYAPGSDVRIAVRVAPDAVRVEVADDGPGIDTVDQRRIFERFYRGANRTSAEGSGLGLAIVKRAVERSGGAVSLDSRPGKGARFTLTLPRAREGAQAA